MTQPTTTVEVEFLPVYVPSEYEKQNPKAFAEGVRNVMAKYVYFKLLCSYPIKSFWEYCIDYYNQWRTQEFPMVRWG